MWLRASSSFSLNPTVVLNLPRLNFASLVPLSLTRACNVSLSLSRFLAFAHHLFNYYSPRSLRHFQGVLTITDGTGGLARAVTDVRKGLLHTDMPQRATLFSAPLLASLLIPLHRLLRSDGSCVRAQWQCSPSRNLIPPRSYIPFTAIYNRTRDLRRQFLRVRKQKVFNVESVISDYCFDTWGSVSLICVFLRNEEIYIFSNCIFMKMLLRFFCLDNVEIFFHSGTFVHEVLVVLYGRPLLYCATLMLIPEVGLQLFRHARKFIL